MDQKKDINDILRYNNKANKNQRYTDMLNVTLNTEKVFMPFSLGSGEMGSGSACSAVTSSGSGSASGSGSGSGATGAGAGSD